MPREVTDCTRRGACLAALCRRCKAGVGRCATCRLSCEGCRQYTAPTPLLSPRELAEEWARRNGMVPVPSTGGGVVVIPGFYEHRLQVIQ